MIVKAESIGDQAYLFSDGRIVQSSYIDVNELILVFLGHLLGIFSVGHAIIIEHAEP